MWSFFSSVINAALGFVFRLGTIKFVLFSALALVLTPLMSLLMSLIEGAGLNALSGLFSALPTDILFWLSVFRLDIGVPMLVAAYLTRFFIRRLPVVG